MTEPVTISLTRGIAEVTLSRPEKLNAMSRLLIKNLTATIANVSGDDTLRCVVILSISDATRRPPLGITVQMTQMLHTFRKSLNNNGKYVYLLPNGSRWVLGVSG